MRIRQIFSSLLFIGMLIVMLGSASVYADSPAVNSKENTVHLSAISQSVAVSNSSGFDPLKQSCDSIDPGVQAVPAVCKEKQADSANTISGAVAKSLNLLTIAAGIIAVIIMIIAGIQMAMSSGDSKKVSDSRNAIIYTAIGVGVIVLARTIVSFIVYRKFL